MSLHMFQLQKFSKDNWCDFYLENLLEFLRNWFKAYTKKPSRSSYNSPRRIYLRLQVRSNSKQLCSSGTLLQGLLEYQNCMFYRNCRGIRSVVDVFDTSELHTRTTPFWSCNRWSLPDWFFTYTLVDLTFHAPQKCCIAIRVNSNPTLCHDRVYIKRNNPNTFLFLFNSLQNWTT